MSDSIILYDFLLVRGGAEAVTLKLHNEVDDLDMGVCFVDGKKFQSSEIESSNVLTLSGHTNIKGWQILKSALFFRYSFKRLNRYKQIVFSGNCAPLAIGNARPDAKKIMYTHTPPRFIYDLRAYYMSQSSNVAKLLLKVLIAFIQPRYENACDQMDLIIANSKNVQMRIKEYLNKEAIVIYPPCETNNFRWIKQGDYYLSTARVENYKRVDLIVKAFINLPDKRLIVASGGAELASLKELARGAPNISFTGWCSETELQELIGCCIATIYLPLNEDFGISPVESMAAGKPVIGINEGGVKETVIDRETGFLCPSNPSMDDIISAVNNLSPSIALSMKEKCQQRAKYFSSDVFIDKMKSLLKTDKSLLMRLAKTIDASATS